MIKQTLIGVSALILIGCTEPNPPSNLEPVKDPTLSEQIRDLPKSQSVDLSNIEGTTSAEKLMHLLDVGGAAKAGTLVGLDLQIGAMDSNGEPEVADELRKTRVTFNQAIDDRMPEFIAEMANIYKGIFSEDELQRLITLYSDPVMRKLVENQTEMMAQSVEYSEVWGLRVAERYMEIIEESADE